MTYLDDKGQSVSERSFRQTKADKEMAKLEAEVARLTELAERYDHQSCNKHIAQLED